NREQRNLVYRRARALDDTMPFGTEYNINQQGWYGAMHSIAVTKVKNKYKRVVIGGSQCKNLYEASRLNCSAMSFGALSAEAIMALNQAAKKGNFYHNTGEGGFSSYHKQGGDIVWQIGTGYFGCRTPDGNFDPIKFKETACSAQIKMIEIKISQGAKPSHGGVLPAAKVTEEIAKIRLVKMGEDVISPPDHKAFNNPIGLMHFIQKLRDLSGSKPVGFKLCIGHKHEFMAICQAMLETKIYPDFITVDGAEGGTGAAPIEFSNRLGLPCIESINFVHNCLIGIGLRKKIKIIGSGKTATGFDVITKLAVGADAVNAARTMMFSLGCIQSQLCNTNRCPTGIATQNPARGKALDVKHRHKLVINFQKNTLKSAFEIMGAMGCDNPDKLSTRFIWRRDDNGINVCFSDIYPQLKENELLEDSPNIKYATHWKMASSNSFHSNAFFDN
ncbi:FMN-binding glutamate synthase family protein, partial [Gammaproteobacteria bacterium]|nr:FMN-binding glutamate synthase family protein [Gammaproteobacteria bacterium]